MFLVPSSGRNRGAGPGGNNARMRVRRLSMLLGGTFVATVCVSCGGSLGFNGPDEPLARSEVNEYVMSTDRLNAEVDWCGWVDPRPYGSSFGVYSCSVRSSRTAKLGKAQIRAGSHRYCFSVPRANAAGPTERPPSLAGDDHGPAFAKTAFGSTCLDDYSY